MPIPRLIPSILLGFLAILQVIHGFNFPINSFHNKLDGRCAVRKCIEPNIKSGLVTKQYTWMPLRSRLAASQGSYQEELKASTMGRHTLPAVGYITNGEVVDVGGSSQRPVAYVKVRAVIVLSCLN